MVTLGFVACLVDISRSKVANKAGRCIRNGALVTSLFVLLGATVAYARSLKTASEQFVRYDYSATVAMLSDIPDIKGVALLSNDPSAVWFFEIVARGIGKPFLPWNQFQIERVSRSTVNCGALAEKESIQAAMTSGRNGVVFLIRKTDLKDFGVVQLNDEIYRLSGFKELKQSPQFIVSTGALYGGVEFTGANWIVNGEWSRCIFLSGRNVELSLEVAPQLAQELPVQLRYDLINLPISFSGAVELEKVGSFRHVITIPKEISGRFLLLRLHVDKSFIPQQLDSNSADNRSRGVLIRRLEY